MKKIFYILVIIALFAGMNCFAAVVTERKLQRPQPSQTQTNNPSTPAAKAKPSLSTNIKTCKPYSETMKSDYLGMNVNYKVTIAGWVNNKCRLDFIAESSGLSSSFGALYGIDPSEATVTSFVPKIRCEFTKQQLEYVGDSILQEEERNAGARNNMLKDPNGIDISGLSNLSASDAKLLSVILGSNACNILNGGNLNNMIQNLMDY